MSIIRSALLIGLIVLPTAVHLSAQQALDLDMILEHESLLGNGPQWGVLQQHDGDAVAAAELERKCRSLLQDTEKERTERDVRRLLTCVRLMERKADVTLVGPLEACVRATHLPASLRRRSALALYRNGAKGAAAIRGLVSHSDDDIRSASLWALAIGSGGSNMVHTLTRVRTESGDLTATKTAEVVNDIQNALDIKDRYPTKSAAEQLKYIVHNIAYFWDFPTPPTGPRIGTSVTAEYLWDELSRLYLADPTGVEDFFKRHGGEARIQELLNSLLAVLRESCGKRGQ